MGRPESATHECQCWIAVMAALLIVISLSDFGLAMVLGSFADIVHQLEGQVKEQHTGMSIANFFSSMTGGFLHLGDSQAGKAIRGIANELPPHWMMASLAWGRVLISLFGFVIGWVMIWWRSRTVGWVLVLWGLLSAVWGLLSASEANVIFRALVAEDLTLVGVILTLLALWLHLTWPLYVSIRVFIGLRKGEFVRSRI